MSSAPSGQMWSGLDAALRAATAVHGMEASCFAAVSASAATYQRTYGALPGLEPGLTVGRAGSLVARMLDGAPAASSDVPTNPALGDSAEHTRLGVHSYVAVPVLTPDGELLGVLAGLDRRAVTVEPGAIALLRGIANALGTTRLPIIPRTGEAVPPGGTGRPAGTAITPPPTPTPAGAAPAGGLPGAGRPGPQPGPTPAARPRPGPPRPAPGRVTPPAAGRRAGTGSGDIRLRRTAHGWIVEGPGAEARPTGDLVSAMVLADLLGEDLTPPGRPRRADRDLDELEELRLKVDQLEHALASRVIVEQAIGVLAERHHIRPRDAFERLRRTARGMGRRVHDLARQVVDSIGDPRASLPGELSAQQPGTPPRPATPTRPSHTRR